MRISLSPVRSDATLALSVSGDCLTVNGESFDFSALPEGATLPAEAIDSPWFLDRASRTDGEIAVTLVLPLGPDAPQTARFPQDIVALADGPVTLPA